MAKNCFLPFAINGGKRALLPLRTWYLPFLEVPMSWSSIARICSEADIPNCCLDCSCSSVSSQVNPDSRNRILPIESSADCGCGVRTGDSLPEEETSSILTQARQCDQMV